MRTIAFVNKGSGGNEGANVLKILGKELGEENVFDIKADKGPERGLSLRAANTTEDIRCIVAGGDGTFSWVANAVEKQNLSNVYLTVIPLGSGNDMSRALGWGKKYPGQDKIVEYAKVAQTASQHRLDVWRLDAVEAPNATEDGADTDADGISHGARPLMCNYLSLGADAHVELRFNQMRWAAPEKYKSRLGNFKAHIVVGTKYMLGSKKIRVAEHIESLTVDGKPITIASNLQALIFLNIPSYGAGTQPWGFPKSAKKNGPMFVNDQQFEVIGLRSLNHFGKIKVLNTHGVRITQGSSMELKLKSPSTPFQVDGEPWEQRGGVVKVERGNAIGVIQGPKYDDDSRKNAKFDAKHDGATDDIGVGTSSQPEGGADMPLSGPAGTVSFG